MRTPLIVLVALLVSCGGPPEAVSPASEGSTEKKPIFASKLDEAKAEVKRLTAFAERDPNLAAWTGPYGGLPPWDKLSAATFPPSFELGTRLMLAEVDVIAESAEPPTFENAVRALEDVGRHLDRAERLFSVMKANLSTPDVQAVDKEWAPKLEAAHDKLKFNAKVFQRCAAVHAALATSGLDAEQKRAVELRFDRFVRAGAKLSAAEKAKVGAINEQLAGLFTEFANKVLAEENTWIVLENEADLAGLSESSKKSYKAAAEERKLSGFAIVNTRSSVDPFLASSTRRDLREKVWKAFKNRGDNGGPNDTNGTIAKIVKLRAERAKLLGFASHAHFRMGDTMAKDPAKAKELMNRVWPAAVARVKEEVSAMEKLAKRDKVAMPFEPWDYLYYAEKVRKAKYDVDEGEIKPYFELGKMIQASLFMAEKLYGLTFVEVTGKVPVFSAGMRVWEVKDKAKGTHVGLFYGEYFARKGKRSGAWATYYRPREAMTGQVTLPLVSNNNNFVKGGEGEPVLISLADARTLFHEFGHALHGLLSEVKYPSLTTTPRDYVEYPSQVHEQWVMTRPILDKFATHSKTGKPMPKALVDKIEASSKFNSGYETVEYLTAAILDMELHTKADGVVDARAFEKETLSRIGAPREVAMRHRLTQFNHLFTSDSYSAGYYSYLWSETMDADTREAFTEAKDMFDPTIAAKMRKFILAPGNTTDRAEAYRQFRGRDPDVRALLRKRGFPTR